MIGWALAPNLLGQVEGTTDHAWFQTREPAPSGASLGVLRQDGIQSPSNMWQVYRVSFIRVCLKDLQKEDSRKYFFPARCQKYITGSFGVEEEQLYSSLSPDAQALYTISKAESCQKNGGLFLVPNSPPGAASCPHNDTKCFVFLFMITGKKQMDVWWDISCSTTF